jgi:hypothetical protein
VTYVGNLGTIEERTRDYSDSSTPNPRRDSFSISNSNLQKEDQFQNNRRETIIQLIDERENNNLYLNKGSSIKKNEMFNSTPNQSDVIDKTEEMWQNIKPQNNRLIIVNLETNTPKMSSIAQQLLDKTKENRIPDSPSSSSSSEKESVPHQSRLTLALKSNLNNLLYNTKNDENLNNSLEEKEISEKYNLKLSASPINLKKAKIYNDTFLSSASRRIENTQIKNPTQNEEETPKFENKERITLINNPNTIYNIEENNMMQERFRLNMNMSLCNQSPSTILLMKTPSERLSRSPISQKNKSQIRLTELDSRINSLFSLIQERNNKRKNEIFELEKENIDLKNIITNIEAEKQAFEKEKGSCLEKCEIFKKEADLMKERNNLKLAALDIIGIKILGSGKKFMKVQILDRINITYYFKEFGKKVLYTLNKTNSNLVIEKFTFEIIKICPNLSDILLDDENNLQILNLMLEKIFFEIYKSNVNISLSLTQFIHNLKLIIKYCGSFFFLLQISNTCQAIGTDFKINFSPGERICTLFIVLMNRAGYKVKCLFSLDLFNAFYSLELKNYEQINISLSETNFQKSKNKLNEHISQVREFLNQREKIKSPFYANDVLLKLHENILQL